MAEENDSIDIDVEMRGALAADAKAASAEAEKLARNLAKVNRQLTRQKKLLAENEAALGSYTAAERLATDAADKHSKSTEKETVETEKFNKTTDEASRIMKKFTAAKKKDGLFNDKLLKFFKSAGRAMAAFGPAAFMVGKALGVAGIAGGAAYAIPLIVTLVNELSSLIAFTALIPSVVGGMIASMLTLKIALAGTGKAFQALTADQKTFDQSLKGLAPAAKTFMKTLRLFMPAFKKLKTATQQAFFAPLDKDLKGMITNNLPTIKKGTKQLASAWGKAFASIMKTMSGGTGKSIFKDMFQSGIDMAHAFQRAAGPILKGIAAVMKVMAPNFAALTKSAGNLGAKFGEWLQKVSKNGKLQKWFDEAKTVARQLWDVMKDVKGIFEGIGKAAGSGGLGSTLGLLLHGLSIINLFLNSPAGQKATKAFFKGLQGILKSLAPLFSVLGDAITTVVVPALESIITGLSPGVTTFLKALADALRTLQPFWKPLATAVGDVLVALTPLLPMLGQMVGIVGQLLTVALQEVVTELGPFIKILGKLDTVFWKFLSQTLAAFLPIVSKGFEAFSKALEPVWPVLDKVAATLTSQFIAFLPTLTKLFDKLSPVLAELAGELGVALAKAIIAILPMVPALFAAFLRLLTIIIDNLPGLMRFGILLLKMMPYLVKLAPLALAFADKILKIIDAVDKVITVIEKFVSKVKAKFDEAKDKVKAVWDKIKDTIVGAIQTAKDKVSAIIDAIKGKITDAIDTAKGLPGKVGHFLGKLNPFGKWAGGPVDANTKYTVGEIGKELYVPNVGKPQMIGTHGQEQRSFASAGTIIPNHLLGMYEKMQAANAKAMAEMSNASRARIGQAQPQSVMNHYDVRVNIEGNVREDVDIERAVKKAIDKAEAERRSRDTGVRVMGRF